jgi:hypothetical protein
VEGISVGNLPASGLIKLGSQNPELGLTISTSEMIRNCKMYGMTLIPSSRSQSRLLLL